MKDNDLKYGAPPQIERYSSFLASDVPEIFLPAGKDMNETRKHMQHHQHLDAESLALRYGQIVRDKIYLNAQMMSSAENQSI